MKQLWIFLLAGFLIICSVLGGGEKPVKVQESILIFSSFDGGGPEYSAVIEDPSILACSVVRDYGSETGEVIDGASYDVVFTFTGLKPGTTTVTIYGISPIMENEKYIYTASVDENLQVTLDSVREISGFYLYRGGAEFYGVYRISSETDGYTLSVNDEDPQPISTEDVDEICRILENYNIAEWDGFDESEKYMLDGEIFVMEVQFTDGTSVRAHGDNVFPENYNAVIGFIQSILDRVVEEM